MKAFDTNVLTEILMGNDAFVQRAAAIPVNQQALQIVVAEEIIRGRLNVIRQAEAGKSRVTVEKAYRLFEDTLQDMRQFLILSHTAQAEALYDAWRKMKVRVSTHDLRIGAICVSHAATLISRNRRDLERIPGLTVDFWE